MIIPVKPDANGSIDIFYEGDENVTQVYFENAAGRQTALQRAA